MIKSRSVYSRPLALVRESSSPIFYLKDLDADQEYLLIITALNSRGTSPPFTLTYRSAAYGQIPTSTPDAFASKQNIAISWSIFVAMLIGVFLTLFACLIAVLYLIKLRSSERRNIPTTPKVLHSVQSTETMVKEDEDLINGTSKIIYGNREF